MDKLNTQIDKQTAQIAKLKEEVADLQADLAALAKSQAEMDAIRQKEHADYVSNKKEMEEGLDGVQLALKVLRDYYAADGDAHGKASGAGGGIIGLLEVIEADFGRSLADANAAEDSAQSEYDRISKENAITKVTKEQDVKYKSKEKASLEKFISEATTDRDGAQTELDAVLEYLEKLKEQCIAKPEPYEERRIGLTCVARRRSGYALRGEDESQSGSEMMLQRRFRKVSNSEWLENFEPFGGDGSS